MTVKPVILLILAIPIAGFAATESDSLSELMTTWLDLESQKGRLQVEWNTRRQSLDRRMELFDAERQALQKVLKNAGNIQGDVDARRLTLLESQQQLETEQTQIKSAIEQTSVSLKALSLRLPPPLLVQWQEKLGLLDQPGFSNSEKLERMLTLLKQVEEFNERIALHKTVMERPGVDGQNQKLFVTQIYLGVNQGWYISDDGTSFGYGRATNLGWQWWHEESASIELGRNLDPQDLIKLRDMLEKPTSASFLSLPVKI